jgi:hydrogenase expression/formation protein HypE
LLIGKIPPHILQNQILPFTGAQRSELVVGPKFGEDCAVVDMGPYLTVLSTDPITGASSGLGRLAVHVSCNDIAAVGAEPIGLLFTVLLPVGTTEKQVRRLMDEAHTTAKQVGVAILGGHTEITSSVEQILITATAIGKVEPEHLVTSSGANPGDHVILTKKAGLEGTAILAADLADQLSQSLPEAVLKEARTFGQFLSVVPEGMLAARLGATAMHDATEGGVRGALVEIAAASQVGLEIWEDQIPLAPETEAICRQLKIDPLGLISSGAMLITAPPEKNLLSALKEAGIPAQLIGRVTHRGLFMVKEGIKKELTAPVRDELYAALERFK